MKNELLQHSVRAISYRFVKSTTGSKENFGNFKISEHTRSPNEIINHLSDLVTKTITMLREGHFNCPPPALLDFDGEMARFVSGLKELEAVLSEKEIDTELSKKLLQGPILDMATHTGQLAMLNGLHGNKIPRESYFSANLG